MFFIEIYLKTVIYLNEIQDGTDNNVMIKRNIYIYFYRNGAGVEG